MSIHSHFKEASQIIRATALQIEKEYSTSSPTQRSTFSVFTVHNQKVAITTTDYVVSTATRALYCKAIESTESSQEIDLNCTECKQKFLNTIMDNELEISLRIMESLRKRGIFTSCGYVTYDSDNKLIKAYFRKDALFKTQQVVSIAPIYLGSFDTFQEVAQREFAITTSKSSKPVLGTWHLVDCVAVLGFNPEYKIGFLFHIDNESNVPVAIQELLSRFEKRTNRRLAFEYILVGGADNERGQTAEERKESIEDQFSKYATTQVSFKRRQYREHVTLPLKEFEQDSFWGRSVRLGRSITIDCTQKDPLLEPMGYEPQLNPKSVFHKRKGTIEETEQFYLQTSPIMKCVYQDMSLVESIQE